MIPTPGRWRLPRLLQDASWISVALSAPQVVRGLVFLALAPLLGPEAYGLMGLAGVIVALAGLLMRDGWTTALLRMDGLSDNLLSTCFWTLALVSLAVLPLILGGGYLLGRAFSEPLLPVIIVALSPGLLAEALGVPARAWLLRNGRSRSVALGSSAAAIAAGLTAVGTALVGLGVWSLVLFNLLLPSGTAAILSMQSTWKPGAHFALREIRPIVGFTVKIVAANTVSVLEQIALRSFVTGVFGTAGLGTLMLARRIVELIAGGASMALGRASLIGLVRDPADSPGRRKTLVQAMRFGLVLAVPVAALLAIAGGPAVLWLAGPDWQQSVPLIRLSAILVLALPLNAILAQWHYSHDRAGLELGLRVLGTVLLLALLPIVFLAGLEGVVLAMAGRAWVLLLCRLTLIFGRGKALAALGAGTVRSPSHPRV